MYGYPVYNYPGNYTTNNDGFGNGWIWAIIIVIFVIFFLYPNNNPRGKNNYC